MTRRARDGDRNDPPPHFCPGCGTRQKAVLRYPWHFCARCCERAEDAGGRRLALTNASIFGGFAWRYANDQTRWDPKALNVICYIDRRKVIVCEARFGGVVAQPLPNGIGLHPPQDDRIVDLTVMTAEQASARLVPVEAPR